MTTDYKLWLKYSKTQIVEAWSETKCEKKYMGIKTMNRNKCKLKWVARVMLRRGIVWFDASNNKNEWPFSNWTEWDHSVMLHMVRKQYEQKLTKQMWSFEFHKLKGWHKGRQAHWRANYNHDQSRRMAWTERNRITGRDRKINKEELDATLGEEYTVHNELRKRQRELRRQNSKTYQSTPIIMTMPSNAQMLTTQTCTWESSLHFSRLRLHALHPQTSSPPSNTSRTPSPPSHTAPLTQRVHAVIHPPRVIQRTFADGWDHELGGYCLFCWTQLNWIFVGGRWRRGDTGQTFQVLTCGMCEHQRWKNFLQPSRLFFLIYFFHTENCAVFEYIGVPLLNGKIGSAFVV